MKKKMYTARVSVGGAEQSFEWDGSESSFYHKLADIMADAPIPSNVYVSTDFGSAGYAITPSGDAMFIREEYNSITGLRSSTYAPFYATMINSDKNNYKFYQLEVKGNQTVATYGRIGGSNIGRFDKQTHIYDGHSMYWIKRLEKLAKGYVDQSAIHFAKDDEPAKKKSEAPKAEHENKAAEELYNLLVRCARQVVQEACVSTDITRKQVEAAEKQFQILCKRKSVDAFNKTLQKLMSISPRRIDGDKQWGVAKFLAKHESDFPSIIQREENLLNAMRALVPTEMGKEDKVEAAKAGFAAMGIHVWEATPEQKQRVLNHIEDPQIKNEVDKVYRVIPKKHQERFDKYLKDRHIHNVKMFWHGSGNENWLSIMQGGLKINPTNVKITGKSCGNGIYFANKARKSFGYTSHYGSYWRRGKENLGIMGLYATAYGNPYVSKQRQVLNQQALDAKGKDCFFLQGGGSFINDEIIFYREEAMVLDYVVTFR